MHENYLNSRTVAEAVKSQIEVLRQNAGENQKIYISFGSHKDSVTMLYKSVSIPNDSLIIFHGVVGCNLASVVQHISQVNFIVHIGTDLGYDELESINF